MDHVISGRGTVRDPPTGKRFFKTELRPVTYARVVHPWKDGNKVSLRLSVPIIADTWARNRAALLKDIGD